MLRYASLKHMPISKKIGAVLLMIGISLLSHTAYSAAQHRVYLRIVQRYDDPLPLDVVIEGIFGFIMATIGMLYVNSSSLKSIDNTKVFERRSIDTLGSPPSFYSFTHRGKILNPFFN